jgi:hypothetical protein
VSHDSGTEQGPPQKAADLETASDTLEPSSKQRRLVEGICWFVFS